MISSFRSKVLNSHLLKKAFVDTNYYAFAQIGSKVISLLIIPYLTRILSLEEFGYYDTFIVIVSLMGILSGSGLDSGIAIKISENQNSLLKLKRIFTLVLMINLVITTVIIIVILLLLEFKLLNFLPKRLWYCIMFFSVVYQSIHTVFNFLRWNGMARKASLMLLTATLLASSTGFLFLYLFNDKSVYHFMTGLIIGNVLALLFWARSFIPYFDFTGKFKINTFNKDILLLSLPSMSNNLTGTLMQLLNRVLLIKFYSFNEIAYFGICYRIAQMPGLALVSVTRGFYPVIFNNYKTDEGQKLGRSILKYYLLGLIPLSMLLYVFSPLLIELVGGEKYKSAITLLPFIVIGYLVLGITQFTGIGYALKRKTFLVMLQTIGALSVLFFIFIFAKDYIGFVGLGYATLIASILVTFTFVLISERLFSFNHNFKLISIVLILLCAAFTYYAFYLKG